MAPGKTAFPGQLAAALRGNIRPASANALPKRAISTSLLLAAGLAFALSAVPAPAHADIAWTLQGVTFAGGGNASGTFVVSSSGTLIAWDLTTTAGGVFPGASYQTITTIPPSELAPNHTEVTFFLGPYLNSNSGGALEIIFDSPLTTVAASDPIQITSLSDEGCVYCNNFNGALRDISSGSASAAAAPEPASLAVLGTAVAALRLSRRRRSGSHREG